MSDLSRRPDRSEAPDYYFKYIGRVPDGSITDMLAFQAREALTFLQRISDENSLYRYSAEKWSIRQVVNHVNDCERLFVFRAFWFARGFDSALPSFDQHTAAAAASSDARPWNTLVEEFRSIRAATMTFFETLPADAWDRRGIASDSPFSVRALAWIAAGHVIHHTDILKSHYMTR